MGSVGVFRLSSKILIGVLNLVFVWYNCVPGIDFVLCKMLSLANKSKLCFAKLMPLANFCILVCRFLVISLFV